jgi:tetratricopeptide (TPR) repeat protein
MDAPRVFHDLILDAVDAESSGGPSCVPSEERPEILFYTGNSLYDACHYELAAKPWRQTIRMDPENATAHNNYALLLDRELGRPEEAEEHYLRALDIDPEDATAHHNYAVLLHTELGRLEEAEDHYQEALDIDSKYFRAHHNYALLLDRELGRPEEAEEHYQEALDIDPENATAHHNYARLLHEKLGRPEEAEEHYLRALDIDPENATAHHNYAGLLHTELGRPEEAEDHYQEALDINPEDATVHHSYAVLLWEELRRPEVAEEHCLKALNINPGYAEAHYSYANLLRELERLEEAEEHLNRALDQWLPAGNVGFALRTVKRLVSIYLRNGNTEAVIEYCDTGLELLDRTDGSPKEFVFFTSRRALAEGDAADTEELYVRGFEAMLYDDSTIAMDLLENAWTRRTDQDSSPSEDETTAAAGIALAALVELHDPDDISHIPSDILDELNPGRIASHSASAVYEQLHDGESTVSPADLRTQAQAHREEGDDVSALECEAMATLLDYLQ